MHMGALRRFWWDAPADGLGLGPTGRGGVRDIWEITPDQVTLAGLDWDAILAEVRYEPHPLLVYGPGSLYSRR